MKWILLAFVLACPLAWYVVSHWLDGFAYRIQTLARIEALIGQYEIERIVLGYPKNMNNTLGERAVKTEAFKEALERRTGLPVVLWDERLTTVAAERVLIESGVRREHRKESVDQIAAAMILQGYLDSLLSGLGDRNER